MSQYGDWKAQCSSSSARATSLEAAVAPIHHRRESACSLDVGFVLLTLQRIGGWRPLLVCALRHERGRSERVGGARGRNGVSGCSVVAKRVPRLREGPHIFRFQ